jgi:hypothetical protein
MEIMMVVDTTASMNSNDASCSGITKLRCAQNGARELMNGLSPTASRIGMMVFPPTSNATEAAKNYDCTTSAPTIKNYKSSSNGLYDVLALSNSFKANEGDTGLNVTSPMVIAMKGGCANGGMNAVGGVGTFYADAMVMRRRLRRTSIRPATNVSALSMRRRQQRRPAPGSIRSPMMPKLRAAAATAGSTRTPARRCRTLHLIRPSSFRAMAAPVLAHRLPTRRRT